MTQRRRVCSKRRGGNGTKTRTSRRHSSFAFSSFKPCLLVYLVYAASVSLGLWTGQGLGVIVAEAAGLPLCGGAPKNMIPFDTDQYQYDAGTRRTRRVLNTHEIEWESMLNFTAKESLDPSEEERETETDREAEESFAMDNLFQEGEGVLPFVHSNASSSLVGYRSRRGRRLQRMPFQMKRVGCGRKRRARVYFENKDMDPKVEKDVQATEKNLAACLSDITKCDSQAYKAASILSVRSKVKAIPKPGNLRGRQYKTCAIVGNAGHMLKKKYGQYIDSHDLVMRFNTQNVAKFKDKVGSKATMRVLNNFHTTQSCCEGKLPEGKNRKIDIVLWFPAARAEMRRACKKKYPGQRVTFLSRRFIGREVLVMKALRKEVLRLGYGPFGGWKQLTSGAHGLLMLLTMCEQVSMYGMTTYFKSRVDQYGGRGKKTRNGNSWHDWKGESHAWRLLHAMREIAICSM